MSAPTEQEMREFLLGFTQSLIGLRTVLALTAVAVSGEVLVDAYRVAKAMDEVAGDMARTFKREGVEKN